MSGREDYNERRQARIERLNAAAEREKKEKERKKRDVWRYVEPYLTGKKT